MRGSESSNLLDHFERVLGPVQMGWSSGPDGGPMPFQIVKFSAGPDADFVSYSTLGLSNTRFVLSQSGRHIHLELLMLASPGTPTDTVVSLLYQVGTAALSSGRPLLRGNVIGPAGPLAANSEMTALYVTMPVYFPDEFATYRGESDVVIAWLVPISSQEADYVASHGWDAFEDQLVDQDPDLVDFMRPGMNL